MTAALQRADPPLDEPASPRPAGEVPLRILHTGFDKLDIAYCGALDDEALATLLEAKTIAQERQEKIRARIGGEDVLVESGAQHGGYRFAFTTGLTGERWAVKDSTDAHGWNIMAKVDAAALATSTPDMVRRQLSDRIARLGLRITDQSLNRVDYAIDLQMPSHFALHLEQVVAPQRSQVRPHWGDQQASQDRFRPGCVLRGRRVETITVGSMKNQQVCIYDKRAQAITKGNPGGSTSGMSIRETLI